MNYDELIDIDIESEWMAAQTSVYQRIEFDVPDPAALASLLLRMRCDDGFVAYLNGQQIAAAHAPADPTYNSHATAERDDAEVLVPVEFIVTQYLDELVAGTNVLAIHGLNVNDASPDLLLLPELVATLLVDEALIETYFVLPTPGAANDLVGATVGPIVRNVTENPPPPTATEDLIITAEVEETAGPIEEVTLFYRVMFGSEISTLMNDSGLGEDVAAGDGIFTADIPSNAYTAGQMVRWYVTATDTYGADSRLPLYIALTNSPKYFGTVVLDTSVSSPLPIFEYFVENVSAAGTRSGTRASVFFLGEFYDNVFIRHRGGHTTHGRKFEFNDGHHFCFDPNLPRVDEINLNEKGAEPTYMRQVLSWDVYAAAGQPASLSDAWHTRRNDQFLDVRIFVEQPDADLLRRTGLDPNGAFYKIGAGGVENSVTSSTAGVTKRTRKDEDNSDLQTLVDGVNPNNPDREQYVFDNVDIASVINYVASTAIIHDNDHPHKNFHLYRDTEGSEQWMFIPWDKDLTFGLNFGLPGIIGDQDPFSHPFFGDQDHQKIDNQWNRLIDAVLEIPSVREMTVRRLRTLMDQFLLPAGSSWIDDRVGELTTDLQSEIGSSSWLSDVSRITGEYLSERRNHLFNNHSIDNPGYPDNAGIPAAQLGNPPIEFSAIEFNPASGNQDQEYIALTNPHGTAVDISGWRLAGGIDFVFRPGTVIATGETLYVSPHVPAFRSRLSGPSGNQGLLVQGNYAGHLSNFGETLRLVAADESLVAETTYMGEPSPEQLHLRISELNYHPYDAMTQFGELDVDNDQFEFLELVNTSTSETLDLDGVSFSSGVDFAFHGPVPLAPGERILVVRDVAAFESRYGSGHPSRACSRTRRASRTAARRSNSTTPAAARSSNSPTTTAATGPTGPTAGAVHLCTSIWP